MKQSLQQTTSLKQEMRMNPRLYQAMDLLYMPLMDLQQRLKEELLVNPFLELSDPDVEQENGEVPVEADKDLPDKGKDENEVDWEDILLDGFQSAPSASTYEDREFYERVPVEMHDLTDHLRDQLKLLDLSDPQYALADEILGNIGDDGYLQASLEDVVRGANSESRRLGEEGADVEREETNMFSREQAEEVLRIVQTLDPPGIGARDLRECLLLQLQHLGESDTLAYKLVLEHFDDLIAHRWSHLAKTCALEPREVQDATDRLAALDPKPGLRYSISTSDYVTPDLIVEKIDGTYRVFLNDTGIPRLRISKIYRDIAADKRKFVGENKEFITNKLNSASWLIQAIEQRRQTMLKVMNFIVDRQRDFFEKGIEHLKPLTLREVADVIQMHESTVSRVTNQKYVQTPRGVYPLKFFFSSSLGTSTGEDASARAVKAQIQKLVSNEGTERPLTDSQLGELLKVKGVNIARRTVAKYRDQLGILPARMRKRV